MLCTFYVQSTFTRLAMTLGSEQIEVYGKFMYLDSCVSAGDGAIDEINLRIVEAREA